MNIHRYNYNILQIAQVGTFYTWAHPSKHVVQSANVHIKASGQLQPGLYVTLKIFEGTERFELSSH